MTQEELAEILNKKPTYISRITRTETIPHVAFLYKIAKVLSKKGFRKYVIEDLYDNWE